mmetsp:Transcript_51817/g.148578  ORF Transcript_51817/g.148578 Transcript_51817/m.148578 type:complete len:225 (+) Transcript_51817:552-1226(+)
MMTYQVCAEDGADEHHTAEHATDPEARGDGLDEALHDDVQLLEEGHTEDPQHSQHPEHSKRSQQVEVLTAVDVAGLEVPQHPARPDDPKVEHIPSLVAFRVAEESKTTTEREYPNNQLDCEPNQECVVDRTPETAVSKAILWTPQPRRRVNIHCGHTCKGAILTHIVIRVICLESHRHDIHDNDGGHQEDPFRRFVNLLAEHVHWVQETTSLVVVIGLIDGAQA